MKRFLVLSCVLVIAATSISFAQTTRTVCTSGCDFSTIQAAATSAVSGDIILINVTGTFTEKNILLPEKSLTIRGLGKTVTFLQSAATRANAASGGRIFRYVAPTGAGNNVFTLEDMTIQNGYAPLNDVAANFSYGAVFLATGSTKGVVVNANRVRFRANETAGGNSNNSGGACFYLSATGSGFTYNAQLSFKNCDFDDNKVGNPATGSYGDGTAICLLGGPGKLTADDCTFTSNSGYSRGGVLYVGGSAWVGTFKNCLFESNVIRSGDGGSIHTGSGSTYQYDNCLFKGNSATGNGGAYFGKGVTFKSCTFYGNTANKGGGICRGSTNGEMQILNCTFYGNTATTSGRSIQIGTTSNTGNAVLMANNIVTNGGGTAPSEIHFAYPYSQLTLNTKNYCNSITTEYGTPGTTPVFDFTSGNTTLGLSSTLASNGGIVQSLALSSSSTLINAGSAAIGSTYDMPAKDQRNYSRFDGAIDVGSYEYNGIADDANVPVISNIQMTNPMSTTNPVVTAKITDDNGIYWFSQLTDLRPRIYYRKNNGAWQNAVGSLQTGDGTSGTWSFSMSTTALGGIANGDQVEYYLIAQDLSSNPSIVSAPTGAVAQNVNSIVTPPPTSSYVVGSTLPVKLERLVVSGSANNVLIRWDVSEQTNLAYYEVERSSNRVNWTAVGRVPASAKRSYDLVDRQSLSGVSYYRLRSVDLDNSFSLSDIKVIRLDEKNTKLSVYPNPVVGREMNVMVPARGTVQLFSSNGVMVWSEKLEAGSNKVVLPQLHSGLYQLKAVGETVQVLVR